MFEKYISNRKVKELIVIHFLKMYNDDMQLNNLEIEIPIVKQEQLNNYIDIVLSLKDINWENNNKDTLKNLKISQILLRDFISIIDLFTETDRCIFGGFGGIIYTMYKDKKLLLDILVNTINKREVIDKFIKTIFYIGYIINLNNNLFFEETSDIFDRRNISILLNLLSPDEIEKKLTLPATDYIKYDILQDLKNIQTGIRFILFNEEWKNMYLKIEKVMSNLFVLVNTELSPFESNYIINDMEIYDNFNFDTYRFVTLKDVGDYKYNVVKNSINFEIFSDDEEFLKKYIVLNIVSDEELYAKVVSAAINKCRYYGLPYSPKILEIENITKQFKYNIPLLFCFYNFIPGILLPKDVEAYNELAYLYRYASIDPYEDHRIFFDTVLSLRFLGVKFENSRNGLFLGRHGVVIDNNTNDKYVDLVIDTQLLEITTLSSLLRNEGRNLNTKGLYYVAPLISKKSIIE